MSRRTLPADHPAYKFRKPKISGEFMDPRLRKDLR